MACACQKNRNKQYEVVTDGGNGKIVYGPIASEASCKAVSKKYPGSIVRERKKAAAKSAAK
ncbi:hypothetical protein [Streptomyces bacillaris]|uniref:hypothetical protein n=1 Tax=Streptomyces bacillaris TaxID=68179 RepID=UPI003627268C